jgi:glutathione S-transferase
LQLLHSPASPFVRKVRIVARELDIASQIELVQVATTPVKTASEVARANPLGKIPALIRDDGPTIFDSRVICRYLDAKAGGSLYPAAQIWEILTLEALCDGMMEAAVLITYERRLRDEDKRHGSWLDGQRGRIERGVAALEEIWLSHLQGPLNAGQVGAGAALGYLDFRHPDLEWRAGRDALARWYATFLERPSMQETAPPDGA